MPLVTWDGTNPAQLTSLLTTTFLKSRSEIVDNVFRNNPFWTWLRVKGMVETQDGGESIQIPLIHGINEAVEAYSGYDLLSVDPQEGISAATYLWKQYHVPVVISGRELMQNRGESAIARLLDAKRTQATKSLTGRLSFDSIMGCAADADRLTGLLQFIYPDPVVQPAAWDSGNISAATYSWWRNQYGLVDGWWATATDSMINTIYWGPHFADANSIFCGNTTDPVTGGIPTGGVPAMVWMYNHCSDGADHPDLILADIDSFENYERVATLQGKNFTNTMWADMGFTNLSFKGATVVSDRNIPTTLPGMWVQYDSAEPGEADKLGCMFFINSAYLTLVVHSERDFTFREFGYPPNQDAYIGQLYWMGEPTCGNRAKQGILCNTGIWAYEAQ